MTCPKQRKARSTTSTRWSKADIRRARKVPLAPLLAMRGLTLQPLPRGNYRIAEYDDLLVKDSFWIQSTDTVDGQSRRGGNAIDFFTQVEGKSFAQAMQILSQAPSVDDPPSQLVPQTSQPQQTI